jgi:exonuclease SbcC
MRMMGYDRLEQMQELLRSDRRDLRNELLGSEGALGDRSNLEGRRRSEKEELSKIELQVQEALKILKDGEAQEQRAQREVGLLENKAKSYKILIDKRKELELISSQLAARYKELSLENEQFKAKYCEQYRIKNGLEGPGALAQLLSELSTNIEQSSAKLEQLEQQIKAQRIALANKESAWQEGLIPLKSRIAVFQSQLKALLDSKLKVEKLTKSITKEKHLSSTDNYSADSEQRCPTCFQVLAKDNSSVLIHFDGEIRRITLELDSSQAILKEQQIQPTEIQEQLESIKLTEQLELEIKNQLIELNQKRNQSQLLERLSLELNKLTEQKQNFALELESIQDQVKQLAFDESGYNQRKLELLTAERLTELARLQKLKLEGEEQTCRAMLHRTEEELLEYDIKLNKLSIAKQRQFSFDQADTVLTEFRRYLNASLRPRLADLASEFLSELTDGRYTTVTLALDFTPSVLEDGEPKPVISGGEEDILNFCLRLALSQMLAERSNQSFSLLILDEIFGSLDHGRRSNVINLLEKLRVRFEQIVIITHIEDLKDLVEHLIYIDYDEASRSVRVASLAEQRDEFEQVSVNI